MPNVNVNQSSSPVSPTLAEGGKPQSMFFMNGEYGYVQLRFSTKKALAFVGGGGLMLLGKLDPKLFDVLWALLF